MTNVPLCYRPLLSTESVFYRPSKQNEAKFREAAEAHARLCNAGRGSDHLALLDIYGLFEHHGMQKDWCLENFLHFRALKTATDIRAQLETQLKSMNLPVTNAMGSSSTTAPAAGASSSSKSLNKATVVPVVPSSPLRQALCAGLFMQSARLMAAGQGWLSVTDNTPLKPELGAAIDARRLPEWLIFTEATGNTMRCVSAVDKSWLDPFLGRLQQVDLERLVGERKRAPARVAGAGGDRGGREMAGRAGGDASERERDPRRGGEVVDTRASRAELAKQRYLERKKKG